MEPEDVVHVLRRCREALAPEGLVLDLQVVRPGPRVECDGRVLCEIDDSCRLRRLRRAEPRA
jgi:hypothetical protein